MSGRITHVAERTSWERAKQSGFYEHPSLEREGYIHCSTPWQVVRIADANFPARDDLVLLVIDPSRIDGRIVFENCEGRFEPFPHIYGTIPVEAVETVWPLEWNAERQSYRFPDGYRA